MKSPFGLLLKKRSSAGGEAKTPRDGSGGKQQPLFASAVERAASSSDAAMPAKPLASVAAPESKAAAAAAPSKPRALAKQESKPPVAVKHAKKLESLQALRYITALQMVGFHYFQNTPWPLFNRANAWGNAPFTFILMLSGFVMAYGYARSNKPIDVSEFLIKRWANLYPLYLVTVVAGFLLIPERQPQPLGLLLILLLGLSGFVPSAFINDINTPGWTIGSLFVLYAIFPFAVRMLKACSPRFRAYVVLPFLFACSIAKPVADLSVNLGALSGLARIAALASIPDFLQGINLGLLFLEHDWERHPMLLQRCGMTASLFALAYLFVGVDLNDCPVFVQLWRPYGMLQFLWMPCIWYAAHGKDLLCYLFEIPLIVYLGNTSFGVYIAQQLLIDYKWQNDPFLQQHQYPRVWEFALLLTVMGAIGYHCIQLPYNPYITKEGTALLKRYRASKLAAYVNAMWRLPETLIGRALVTLAFVPAYVAYTNWQPCRYVDFSRLGSRRWFDQNDANWLLNWYATPCTPRRLLPVDVATAMEFACMALSALGVVGFLVRVTTGLIDAWTKGKLTFGSSSAASASPAMALPEDAAVVLRLVCKPSSMEQDIMATLASLTKAAEGLKAEGAHSVQIEVVGCPATLAVPAGGAVDVTVLAMPFEAARTRSQIQPKDVVITFPVGARLEKGAVTLKALLAHYNPAAAVAFPLSVDGTAEALPSLGSLAELNFIGPHRRPCLILGSASLTHALSSTATAAALEHGATDDSSSTTLKPAPKTHTTAWAHHATPSLGAYIARRLAFTRRASLSYTPLEKAREAARLLLESFFHLGFVLAIMLIIGTPVSLYYTPGNYCNFYWSNQCTNGQNIGTSLPRFVATCVAAVYTAGYYARFLSAFRASEAFVRQVILTFLLLFFLPVTAAVDAYVCLKAVPTMLIAPGARQRQTSSKSDVAANGAPALVSPSAVA